MKRVCSMKKSYYLKRRSRGFTLIELLVVFSIIAILSSVSVASFVSYSRSQELKSAASDVSTLLSQAKSRAQSQVKPDVCGTSQLEGYEVRICGLTGSSCSEVNSYALYVRCGTTQEEISSQSLPDSLEFSQEDTTSTSYFFRVLHQGVSVPGTVAITGYGQTVDVSVTSTGTISVQ